MTIAQLSYGIGRRKQAVAQVTLKVGNGNLIINKKDGKLYLQNNSNYIQKINSPFVLLGIKDTFDL